MAKGGTWYCIKNDMWPKTLQKWNLVMFGAVIEETTGDLR
jgi:hypothetical protein